MKVLKDSIFLIGLIVPFIILVVILPPLTHFTLFYKVLYYIASGAYYSLIYYIVKRNS